MRVGLVLGAGGIVGASYLTGALEGLRRATGFTPSDARVVVGTSAGAFVGTLALTTSVPLLYTHCTGIEAPGARLSPSEHALAAKLDRHNHGTFLDRYPPAWRIPRPFGSSPAAMRRAVVERAGRSPELFVTGLLGEGLLSTKSVGSIVEEAAYGVWPNTDLRLLALDLDTGERVVLRGDARPHVRISQAVRASIAVPALFSPMRVGGRRLVDGGTWSTTNLDILLGEPLDAVLAIVPLGGGARDLRVRSAMRRRVDAKLRGECALLEARGVKTMVLTPNAEDHVAMPANFLDFASREAVVRHAAESVARRLSPGGDAAAIGAYFRSFGERARDERVS